MPRGPVVFTLPPGTTPQQPNTVIQSSVWNAAMDDIAQAFNTVQPIQYGGTGVPDGKPLSNTFGVKDSTDPTKLLAFDISGYSTGTTRTVTWPNGNGTVMFTNTAIVNSQALTGSVVSSGLARQTAYFLSTAAIPVDDTIPTSTEGDQIATYSFTPKAVGNKVRIRASIQCSRSNAGTVIAALHNGGATAIGVTFAYVTAAGLGVILACEAEYTLASVAVQNISLRIGPGDNGGMYINGNNIQRYFGGSVGATLVVEEIKG